MSREEVVEFFENFVNLWKIFPLKIFTILTSLLFVSVTILAAAHAFTGREPIIQRRYRIRQSSASL